MHRLPELPDSGRMGMDQRPAGRYSRPGNVEAAARTHAGRFAQGRCEERRVILHRSEATMIRTRKWLFVVGAAVAVFCATCAPEPPPDIENKATRSGISAAEETASAPIPDTLKKRVEAAIDNVKQRNLS